MISNEELKQKLYDYYKKDKVPENRIQAAIKKLLVMPVEYRDLMLKNMGVSK